MRHAHLRIIEAFEETMRQGTEYWEWHAQKEPEPGTMLTAEEIARYADDVITRLERWWASLEDKSGRQPVTTYMGEQPMHALSSAPPGTRRSTRGS